MLKNKVIIQIIGLSVVGLLFLLFIISNFPFHKEYFFSKNIGTTNNQLTKKPASYNNSSWLKRIKNKVFSSRASLQRKEETRKDLFLRVPREQELKSERDVNPSGFSKEFNLTQGLAKQLFEEQVSQLGTNTFANSVNLSDVDEEKLEEGFLKNVKTFDKKNLVVLREKNPAAIRSFFSFFLDGIDQVSPFSDNFKEAFQSFVQTRQTSKFKELEGFIDEYLANVKELKVPEEYLSLFVDFLNQLLVFKAIVRALRNYEEDPAKAIVALNLVPQNASKINDILQSLNKEIVEFIAP